VNSDAFYQQEKRATTIQKTEKKEKRKEKRATVQVVTFQNI
jgi:hypothetical protein